MDRLQALSARSHSSRRRPRGRSCRIWPLTKGAPPLSSGRWPLPTMPAAHIRLNRRPGQPEEVGARRSRFRRSFRRLGARRSRLMGPATRRPCGRMARVPTTIASLPQPGSGAALGAVRYESSRPIGIWPDRAQWPPTRRAMPPQAGSWRTQAERCSSILRRAQLAARGGADRPGPTHVHWQFAQPDAAGSRRSRRFDHRGGLGRLRGDGQSECGRPIGLGPMGSHGDQRGNPEFTNVLATNNARRIGRLVGGERGEVPTSCP